jgi:outer membrane protein assembly factor BamB
VEAGLSGAAALEAYRMSDVQFEISRYYNGVGLLRTTIYCAALFFPVVFDPSGRPAPGQANSAQSSSLFASQWKLTLPDGPSAAAGYDSAQAYIPLRNGTLIAVALKDGQPSWTVDAQTTLAPAAGGTLVFVAGDKDIRALDAASGQATWRVVLEEPANLAPLFDTGWLFVGTENGHLVALRAADGEVVWTLDAGAPLNAPPAPAGNSIYLPLTDGRIVAVDVRTGRALWTRTLPGPPSDILALDDRLFVGSADNYFYCIALKDGGIKWKWRTGSDIVAAPVVDESRVYFMSLDNVLRALDRASGSQRWQRAMASRTVGGPMHSGSVIVVATLSPQLQAYQRIDGKPAGASPTPEGDEQSSTLAAVPQVVSLEGHDAFVLLTSQGVIQLFSMTS